MSANDFKGTTTLQKLIFQEKAWKEKLPSSFWSQFWEFPTAGPSEHIDKGEKTTEIMSAANMPVVVIRDLMKQQGDTVKFPLTTALRGDGIVGTSGRTLKDNMEEISAYTHSVELEEYAHAVGDRSPKGRKRTMFDVPSNIKDALLGWGVEKLDKLCFEAIEASPTTILYPNAATSISTLTAGDKVTMEFLRKAAKIAGTRNNGARFMIEPFKFKGRSFYFAVASHDVFHDLESDPEYLQAVQNAYERGDFYNHPIFAGADAISSGGVVLFKHERATNTLNWGAGGNLPGGKITLFGNRALCVAMGFVPQLLTEKEDFERQIGYGLSMMLKVSKPNFNTMDFGSMQLRVIRSQITDA